MKNEITGSDVSAALAGFMPASKASFFESDFWKKAAKDLRKSEGSPVGKYAVFGSELQFVRLVVSETIHFIYLERIEDNDPVRRNRTEVAFYVDAANFVEVQAGISRATSSYRLEVTSAKIDLRERLEQIKKDYAA